MKLSQFVARRYLFSKNNPNAINIISGISMLGFAVGAMALVTVMSVFNGFESLVQSLYTSFDPDLKIEVRSGKVFHTDSFPLLRIQQHGDIETVALVLEENVVLVYDEKQTIATMKGVSPEYVNLTRLDSMVYDGQLLLQSGDQDFAVAGLGVAARLGLSTVNDFARLIIYMPKRGEQIILNPERAVNQATVIPSGVFSIDDEINNKYVIVPLRLAHRLMEYRDEISSVEIKLKPGVSVRKARESLVDIVGPDFTVKDQAEQQAALYKVFRYEKWATALILVFILVLLTFTVVSSLSMLVMEKKGDIHVLRSMGARDGFIRSVFLREGMMIALIGGVIGIGTGFVLCWLQETYGLVGFGGMGTFIVSAYPVKMNPGDFVVIFLFIVGLGFLTSWFPAQKAVRMGT